MDLVRGASGAERDRSIEALEYALGEGRITAPEFEERVEAAFLARTRADLAALTAGLPRGLW
ncbi:DUF1707 domain-containing protein [Actinokineospora sp. PR83]|uniref:DUF1707 SHOCT-like domain-containing protein n=1 Tax=Actinokineospora sp. PR83 TaxID=2884908 RepID=UPI0027DF0E68|nr:DUF1707 domain-containing protein [Actinokineospora sp. PR83]MCG8916052.1 DUF1707 domain-containing protein [Actinokineospora sp. PR83]